MKRPTVLILASDPAFSREITAHWSRNSDPDSGHCEVEFTVLDQDFSSALAGSNYDLAIADGSSEEKKKNKRQLQSPNQDLKPSLAAAGKPAIIIRSGRARDFYSLHGQIIELRREPGIWPALTALLGREIVRRRQAESSAQEAERSCAAAQAEATLGRYMVEMRTNVNNALTTVLGNAELLVHEPGLSATVVAQADALRNMALRLHEIFQRFSSLEKELTVAARESGKKSNTAAAGR
ncbi:MAG: hypothetical protein WCF61_01190 [Terriglobales bacterium]